jgi:transposase
MNGCSEDLSPKIVCAVEGDISNTQAAPTFDVSLSSVKRYLKKADPTQNPSLRTTRAPDLFPS